MWICDVVGVVTHCSRSTEKSISRAVLAVAAPAADALVLLRALLALACLLLLVTPLRALHPAAQQRDRVDLALDRREVLLHRLAGGDLAVQQRVEGLERQPHGCVGAVGAAGGDRDAVAVAHLHLP